MLAASSHHRIWLPSSSSLNKNDPVPTPRSSREESVDKQKNSSKLTAVPSQDALTRFLHYTRCENDPSDITTSPLSISARPNHHPSQRIRLQFPENDDLSSIPTAADETMTTATRVIASALVTMEELVRFTLQYQLLPKVVAEFPSITVGGAIAGGGIESSSYRYGLFSQSVSWMALVNRGHHDHSSAQPQPRRRLVTPSDDLFGRVCCGFSATTSWMIVEACIECIPIASRFVHVSYQVCPSIEQLCQILLSSTSNEFQSTDDCKKNKSNLQHFSSPIDSSESIHFVDGLQFPAHYSHRREPCGVVIRGRILDPHKFKQNKDEEGDCVVGKCYHPIQRLGWKRPQWAGPFYYEHVWDLIGDLSGSDCDVVVTEVIDLVDYLFRYDSGAFWMARPMCFQWRNIFSYLPFTFGLFVLSHRWMRNLGTGWLFASTQRLYRLLHAVPPAAIARNLVIQDFFLIPECLPTFINFLRRTIPLSVPLWLCPVATQSNHLFSPNYDDREKSRVTMMINVGVYGRVADGRAMEYTSRLEQFVASSSLSSSSSCQSLQRRRKQRGRKMLYAASYSYSPDQFHAIYHHPHLNINKDEKSSAEDRKEEEEHRSYAVQALYEKTCQPSFELAHRSLTWKEWLYTWII